MTRTGGYILWLPLWYPNRTEPFSGDFIQRHARAASAFRNIEVLVAIRDLSLRPGTTEEVRSQTEGLSETIIYYNSPVGPFRLLNRLRSFLAYCRLIMTAAEKMFQSKGIPSALHAHIYGRNCFIAKRLADFRNIPLFYSEHQSGFIKESPHFFLKKGSAAFFLFSRFLSATSGVTFVSNYLGASVKKDIPDISYSVIPNVVDDLFFRPSADISRPKRMRFIHISTLRFEKNFDGILFAFKRLAAAGHDFELRVFGPVTVRWRTIVREAGIESHVHFEGEQPHDIILPYLQSADALILYSRFETFGCVVIEAHACGVPVIVSDIPAMRELVREGEDGILVPGEQPEKLAYALQAFVSQPLRPNRASLHQHTAERFGMRKVGELFERFYTQS